MGFCYTCTLLVATSMKNQRQLEETMNMKNSISTSEFIVVREIELVKAN